MSELASFIWPLALAALPTSTAAALFNKYILNSKHGAVKWLAATVIIVIPVLIHAFLTTKFTNDTIVATQIAVTAFFATPFYLVALKPLIEAIETYNEKKEKAAAWDAQVKSAAEPIS